MKKKLSIALLCIIILIGLAFAEYRYIMLNICPYCDENDTIYIEIFGQIDVYDLISKE